MHWVLDQAAINAYKLATEAKTWTKGYLEFRRALYRKLLAYSKLIKSQLWKDPGPHIWVPRLTHQSCVWCYKAVILKKKLLALQEEVRMKVVKKISNVKQPTPSQLRCAYCDVTLCKMSDCWTRWHSQAG